MYSPELYETSSTYGVYVLVFTALAVAVGKLCSWFMVTLGAGEYHVHLSPKHNCLDKCNPASENATHLQHPSFTDLMKYKCSEG